MEVTEAQLVPPSGKAWQAPPRPVAGSALTPVTCSSAAVPWMPAAGSRGRARDAGTRAWETYRR
jgi:hypothetical protein